MHNALISIRAAFLICATFVWQQSAYAAEITAPWNHVKAYETDKTVDATWPTDPVKCDLILSGDIVDGDAVEFQRQFATLVDKSLNGFSFFLCLRSNGGVVQEALKIARFVLATSRPSISTVVEDGQTCASACALIFLAGNAPAARGDWPLRFLHPRGKLLFHSSRLDLLRQYGDDAKLLDFLTRQEPGGPGLRDKITALYSEGLRDEQNIISTFQKFRYQREDLGDPWVRPSLFLEMFSQDPNEWVCVDNIDAVGRWNVQVFGYSPPKTPRKSSYFNVCTNAYNWRLDRSEIQARLEGEEQSEPENEDETKEPPPARLIVGRNRASEGFDRRFVVPYSAPLLALQCVVEVSTNNDSNGQSALVKKQVNAQSDLTVSFTDSIGASAQLLGSTSRLNATSYFPASTLLADLPGVRSSTSRQTSRRPSGDFIPYDNSLMNGCSYKSVDNLDKDQCQTTCGADGACAAYSYNKVTHACELKHTLTARRLEPMWTSGVPSPGPLSETSSRPTQMKPRSMAEGRGLDGSVIDTSTMAEDSNAPGLDCARRCESDRTCRAVQFDNNNARICRMFSTIKGIKKEASSAGIIEIYVKTQHW